MKLREYMNLVENGDEITCWDKDVDSEFYFYKKDVGEKPDKEFPNYDKCLETLIDNLDVVSVRDGGLEVNLYGLLENPKVIAFAKERFYEETQYEDDSDVTMLLFDDNVNNISQGYENFSKMMIECLNEAFPPQKGVKKPIDNTEKLQGEAAVVLQVEKETAERPGEMFYRYLIGDFRVWFTQDQKSGNIYSVGVREQGDALKNIELFVGANEEARGGYYPNVFTLRPRSQPMTVEESQVYAQKVLDASVVLDKIKEFFETGKHYELYCKHHGEKTVNDLIADAADRCGKANSNSQARCSEELRMKN